MAEDTNTLALLLRLAMSFGMVLALVGGITWALRRRGLLRPGAAAGTSGRLEVLDRRSVGKNASLVLARVGGTAVLLGVTGERIEVLSDKPGLDAAWSQATELDPTSNADPARGVEQGSAISAATPLAAVADEPAVGGASVIPLTAATTAVAGAVAAPSSTITPLTPLAARTGGARRTGFPKAAPAADRTRMSFIEALQELTVRRS